MKREQKELEKRIRTINSILECSVVRIRWKDQLLILSTAGYSNVKGNWKTKWICQRFFTFFSLAKIIRGS